VPTSIRSKLRAESNLGAFRVRFLSAEISDVEILEDPKGDLAHLPKAPLI
jgi:hypothetical protein